MLLILLIYFESILKNVLFSDKTGSKSCNIFEIAYNKMD